MYRPVRFALIAVLAAICLCVPQWIDRSKEFQTVKNGIVVITGASSGLGKDAALTLAQRGIFVIAGARNERKANTLQTDAETELRRRGVSISLFRAVALDVTSTADWETTLELTKSLMRSEKRPFCGIINNAGLSPSQLKKTRSDPTTMEMWRKTFDVNVFGIVRGKQVFEDLLRSTPGSRLVNVGSVMGEISLPHSAAYSGTKFALRAITDAWRVEFEVDEVSVSLVEPGYVKSNMCRPDVESNCGKRGPEETTTPAYLDALLSARPRSKYLVSDMMYVRVPFTQYEISVPSWFLVPVLDHIPARVRDVMARSRV